MALMQRGSRAGVNVLIECRLRNAGASSHWARHPHWHPVRCSRRFPAALVLVFLPPWVCLPVSVCRAAVEVLRACDVEQTLFECVGCVFWKQDFSLI